MQFHRCKSETIDTVTLYNIYILTNFIKLWYNVVAMNTRQKLKIIQKISGLTQEKIATKIGVSFVAFNNWFTGKSLPRKNALKKIDRLYKEYTGEKEISSDELSARKAGLSVKSKKYKNILKTIIRNQDIFDQFVLALTYHSNRIEGSTLSENETSAILFENAILPDKTLIEQLEAKNHQTAINYLFDYLEQQMPINESLILRLHTILLNGIHRDAGFYRRHGVRIVGANLPTANFLKVPELMKKSIRDINSNSKDIIAKTVEIHSRFEQIHPFADGNGRIGRLIMQAMLLRDNYPPAIIDQEQKVLYLKYLNISQTKGDFSLLENFICEAIFHGYKILER